MSRAVAFAHRLPPAPSTSPADAIAECRGLIDTTSVRPTTQNARRLQRVAGVATDVAHACAGEGFDARELHQWAASARRLAAEILLARGAA